MTRSHLRNLLALCLAPLACVVEQPSPTGTGGGGSGANGGSAGASPSGGSAGAVNSGGYVSVSGGSAGSGTGGVASGGSAGYAGNAGAAGVGGASGAAGFSGSGGSGGTGMTFEPCPAAGPCKILPLGDSITDGFGTPGGYRIPLFALAVADQKEITFVGGSMNGPDMVSNQPFPRSHEGHSGWTIAQIDGIVPNSVVSVEPHIILLHIGTNDLSQMANGAPDRLETLVDQILDAAPEALLVVAQITPFPAVANAVTTFNAAVPGIVQERATAGAHIILVDQFTGFVVEDELDDPVHPNPAGYSRMANVWYAAIATYLH